MVQLFIKIGNENGDCPEWTIVELQGDLETKSQAASLSGKSIGDLHFTHKNQPILIIGHHILQGKLMTLDKPIAVISRNATGHEADVLEDSMEVDCVTNDCHYTVKAIVKNKLLFKIRPKPIIAHVPKKL